MKRRFTSHLMVELMLVLATFIIVSTISFICQNRISLNSGKGWDGEAYYSVADQFSRGQLPHGEAPFLYRMGTPFLASLVKAERLLDSFLLVNLLANVGAVFLLLAFFRMYLKDWRIRTMLLMLFMFQWHGPVRSVFFCPAQVDPLFLILLIASLLLLTKLKSEHSRGLIVHLGLLMLIGAVVREAILLVAVAVIFIGNPIDDDLFHWKSLRAKIVSVKYTLYLPLLAGICGLILTHLLATPTNKYSFLRTAVFWAYCKSLASYILAWFIAFGPILAVLLYDIKGCCRFLMQEQHLFIIVLGYAFLAWVGGSDTERILYWAMPVVYMLIGRTIERRRECLASIPLSLTILVLQVVSQRLLWATPDYPSKFSHKIPFLTPIGENVPYLDLFSWHGKCMVESVALVQYALCALCILIWMHNRSVLEYDLCYKGINGDK